MLSALGCISDLRALGIDACDSNGTEDRFWKHPVGPEARGRVPGRGVGGHADRRRLCSDRIRRPRRLHLGHTDSRSDTSDPRRRFAVEKTMIVAKLQGARDRSSLAIGRRIEGRRSHTESNPELLRQARRLHRRNPVTGERRSLRKIAAELKDLGFDTANTTSPPAAQSSDSFTLSLGLLKTLCSRRARMTSYGGS
jgi:hypothetical protein